MADLMDKPREPVTPAEVEREVDALVALANKEAQRIRDAKLRSRDPRKSGPVRAQSPRKPDARDLMRADILSALTQEVVIAPEVSGDRDIEASEFDREIMKRALIKLKLSDLRDEAESRGLDPRGTEEDVASRLVQALKFDEQAIAELVLRHEDDSEIIRGFTERIFALRSPLDLDLATAVVRPMAGRYVRVGVARWFVFQSITHPGQDLSVSGLFRSFRAEPTEIDDEYAISPIEVSARATARFRRSTNLVRVESKGIAEASGCLDAITKVVGALRSPYLPITFDLPLDLIGWDRKTIYLLDLVAHGFADPPLFVQNLTATHFETDDAPQNSEIAPRIRSIKLEGDWVGDSPQACQMLVAKRTLVGVSMIVRYTPRPEETSYFPVRVNVTGGHVDVVTGLGRERSDVAKAAHRVIVERVERGLARLTDPDKTRQLIARIIERADARGPVNVELLSSPAGTESTMAPDPLQPPDPPF